MAIRSETWKDTMNIPQTLVTHLDGGFHLLMTPPGHRGEQYMRYSDTIPMARSLVHVKHHKPGGLWAKWVKLRESGQDEWIRGSPEQADEIILEMTMLVMEDPTDAEVASSRVEDLVQKILRGIGIGDKIGSMTAEWWYALVLWIVTHPRKAPRKEVAAKWLHKIQQKLGVNRGGAAARERPSACRDEEERRRREGEEGGVEREGEGGEGAKDKQGEQRGGKS